MITEEEQSLALMYDPFEGDFGEPDDLLFKDKFVKTRKEHTCFVCESIIPVKTICRSTVWKFSGEIHTYHYCPDCCKAMAMQIKHDYDEDPLQNRFYLRK